MDRLGKVEIDHSPLMLGTRWMISTSPGLPSVSKWHAVELRLGVGQATRNLVRINERILI